jgi:dolichyl-phosphate beta-glucosyltransferase
MEMLERGAGVELVDQTTSATASNLTPETRVGDRRWRGMIQTVPRDVVDVEVVIPALNDERRIGTTVETVAQYLARQTYSSALVIVDNGSVDRTPDIVAEIASDSRVAIHLTNCARRGRGAAIRQGIYTSRARWVGFCDADLATPIETLDRVWRLLERGVEVVIGSRRFDDAQLVRDQRHARQLGGAVFRAVADRLLPGVSDTQCGFKFFQGRAAHELIKRCTVDGFAFDLELLVQARAVGLAIVEVPVAWCDPDGLTLRPVRNGVRALADALRLSRVRPADRHRRARWRPA